MWLIGKDRTEHFKIIALVSDLAMADNKNNILHWWSFLSLVQKSGLESDCMLLLTQLSTNSPENLLDWLVLLATAIKSVWVS